MLVIASYYILFAVMGGSTHALLVEAAVAIVFWPWRLSIQVLPLARRRALASHGILDVFIVSSSPIQGASMVAAVCLAYDGGAGYWHSSPRQCQRTYDRLKPDGLS